MSPYAVSGVQNAQNMFVARAAPTSGFGRSWSWTHYDSYYWCLWILL